VQTFIEVPFKPWTAAPPKLRTADEVVEAEPVAQTLVSTAISSQDEVEA
jgi:hypothetical protein